MTILHRVEELSMQYGSGSRRAIGTFIMEERWHLHELSVQDIAEKTYTSKASLTRFAKELGYSGWREFIKAFSEEQRHQNSHYTDVDPNIPFCADSSKKDILNIICSLQVESLLDTADLLEDNDALEKTVRLMQESRRIVVFGLNPNLSLAELFKRKMMSIGRQVETPTLGDIGLLATTLNKEDCAIVISYSGNSMTHPTMKVLPVLMANKVPIVAMTSEGDNILRRQAAYTFTISSREKLYNKISTYSTETSILFILNVLFSCYFAKEYEKNLKFKIEQGFLLETPRLVNPEEEK